MTLAIIKTLTLASAGALFGWFLHAWVAQDKHKFQQFVIDQLRKELDRERRLTNDHS